MKKLFIASVFLFYSLKSFAFCSKPIDFDYSFIVHNNQLSIDIQRKDKKEFQYFNLDWWGYPIFIGFRFEDFFLNLNEKTHISNLLRNKSSAYSRKEKFLFTENDTLYSSFLEGDKISQVYARPFEREYFSKTNHYHKTIDLNNFITVHKERLEKKGIRGHKKIKFYTKIIHSNDLNCTYFESPMFSYNFTIYQLK